MLFSSSPSCEAQARRESLPSKRGGHLVGRGNVFGLCWSYKGEGGVSAGRLCITIMKRIKQLEINMCLCLLVEVAMSGDVKVC